MLTLCSGVWLDIRHRSCWMVQRIAGDNGSTGHTCASADAGARASACGGLSAWGRAASVAGGRGRGAVSQGLTLADSLSRLIHGRVLRDSGGLSTPARACRTGARGLCATCAGRAWGYGAPSAGHSAGSGTLHLACAEAVSTWLRGQRKASDRQIPYETYLPRCQSSSGGRGTSFCLSYQISETAVVIGVRIVSRARPRRRTLKSKGSTSLKLQSRLSCPNLNLWFASLASNEAVMTSGCRLAHS